MANVSGKFFVMIFQHHHDSLVCRVSHDDGGESVNQPTVVVQSTAEQFVNHPSIAVAALVAKKPTRRIRAGIRREYCLQGCSSKEFLGIQCLVPEQQIAYG